MLAPVVPPVPLEAQEALKSAGEEYYDFLSLLDLSERPALNYRTLSDSEWTVSPGARHPWSGLNLGRTHNWSDRVALRVYGPELFVSVNTGAPYGYYDGALWQGRGLNSSLSAGLRLEVYGFELTFKPQLSFSQNLEFDIMPSAYPSEYGYFWGYGIDAPQRFGKDPFLVYDWGDSELRYTWKTLTLGFGTQSVWLGPAKINPILHSNNAPSYPKFDIGLRRQPVTIPWLNWYIGDFEARLWIGRLTESGYFDNDTSNDNTMFHGFSLAYAPSFVPGLTLSVNRVCLVPWERENLKYMFP
ncbi:MAG: capsule assembly Wzi family protein, partial [Treponema sp.]|nr:capsule assembly Wzi family protein [Treponema sp.]